MLIVHVDDLMVAGDSSEFVCGVSGKLHQRFPSGTWQRVAEQAAGVTFCGKEIKDQRNRCIDLSQKGFADGRLDKIQIEKSRMKDPDQRANETEMTDFRSAVGSLQWLSAQSRPDLSFELNQLQKRAKD